jgi:hypothetical protein
MDLNYLFYRQQVERARAEHADGDEARVAHEHLARCYETRIELATGDDFRLPVEEPVENMAPEQDQITG